MIRKITIVCHSLRCSEKFLTLGKLFLQTFLNTLPCRFQKHSGAAFVLLCGKLYILLCILVPQYTSQSLTSTCANSTCIRLTWREPEYPGGQITGYQVC